MRLLLQILDLYSVIIIARALISWFNLSPANPLVQFLHAATEPVLAPLRRLVSPEKLGGLDISPMLVIVAIVLLKRLIIAAAVY